MSAALIRTSAHTWARREPCGAVTHLAGRGDTSARYNTREGYDGRCSSCVLGHGHTIARHAKGLDEHAHAELRERLRVQASGYLQGNDRYQRAIEPLSYGRELTERQYALATEASAKLADDSDPVRAYHGRALGRLLEDLRS